MLLLLEYPGIKIGSRELEKLYKRRNDLDPSRFFFVPLSKHLPISSADGCLFCLSLSPFVFYRFPNNIDQGKPLLSSPPPPKKKRTQRSLIPLGDARKDPLLSRLICLSGGRVAVSPYLRVHSFTVLSSDPEIILPFWTSMALTLQRGKNSQSSHYDEISALLGRKMLYGIFMEYLA